MTLDKRRYPAAQLPEPEPELLVKRSLTFGRDCNGARVGQAANPTLLETVGA